DTGRAGRGQARCVPEYGREAPGCERRPRQRRYLQGDLRAVVLLRAGLAVRGEGGVQARRTDAGREGEESSQPPAGPLERGAMKPGPFSSAKTMEPTPAPAIVVLDPRGITVSNPRLTQAGISSLGGDHRS